MLENYGKSGGFDFNSIKKSNFSDKINEKYKKLNREALENFKKLETKQVIDQKGTKFDAGKSRLDLIEYNSYAHVMSMVRKARKSKISNMSKEQLARFMGNQYVGLFSYMNYPKHLIGIIGNISTATIEFLGTNIEIEDARLLGDLYGHGADMHGVDNWKKVDPIRFFAALGRHISDIIRGEVTDSDSGLPHAIHILWNCITLVYFWSREDGNK